LDIGLESGIDFWKRILKPLPIDYEILELAFTYVNS
jgi:hypothetical protein